MIKVVIVDDEEIFREGIKYIIEQDKDISVVGEACNGIEGIEKCERLLPDLILMDIVMPECDGIEATRIIKSKFDNIKIIMLTTFNDEVNISKAICNGADSYILKDIAALDLLTTIKSCTKGFNIIQKRAFSNIAKHFDEFTNKISVIKKDAPDAINLTQKQKDLIKLIVEGKDNKEIASILFLSEGTVRNSISRLLKKLNLKDRIQLAVYAVKNDIL